MICADEIHEWAGEEKETSERIRVLSASSSVFEADLSSAYLSSPQTFKKASHWSNILPEYKNLYRRFLHILRPFTKMGSRLRNNNVFVTHLFWIKTRMVDLLFSFFLYSHSVPWQDSAVECSYLTLCFSPDFSGFPLPYTHQYVNILGRISSQTGTTMGTLTTRPGVSRSALWLFRIPISTQGTSHTSMKALERRRDWRILIQTPDMR